jgi:hypothetical protein
MQENRRRCGDNSKGRAERLRLTLGWAAKRFVGWPTLQEWDSKSWPVGEVQVHAFTLTYLVQLEQETKANLFVSAAGWSVKRRMTQFLFPPLPFELDSRHGAVSYASSCIF